MTEPTRQTRHRTTSVEPLLRREPEPAPVDGCAGCTELANLRDRARGVGDATTVSDCNVYMRRHPEGHG